MNYEELEQRYDAFLAHEKFPDIEKNAERLLQNPDVDEETRSKGNWEYNVYFLENYFDRPKSYGYVMSQTPNSWLILLSNRVIDLNTCSAPNFRDKENYLSWLHRELNK